MLELVKETDILPDDFDGFRFFNIDMGAALFDQRIGPPTKEETKLYGEMLWEVERKTVEVDYDKSAPTVADMTRLAKKEKENRADQLASFVAGGVDMDEARRMMGPVKYGQDWIDR